MPNVFDHFRAAVDAGLIAQMSAREARVYMVLLKHADSQTGEAWPSMETIAEQAGITNRQQCREARNRLIQIGLIELLEEGGGRFRPAKVRLISPHNTGTKSVPVKADLFGSETGTESVPELTEKQGRIQTYTGTDLDGNRDGFCTQTGTESVPRTTQELPKEQPKGVRGKKRKAADDEPLPEVPPALRTENFLAMWERFKTFRSVKKKEPVTAMAAEMMFKKFIRWGADVAVQAMEDSIIGSWQGVWEPRQNKSRPTNGAHPPRQSLTTTQIRGEM